MAVAVSEELEKKPWVTEWVTCWLSCSSRMINGDCRWIMISDVPTAAKVDNPGVNTCGWLVSALLAAADKVGEVVVDISCACN